MVDYTVTMTRSSDLSDEEVRRRLAQAYRIILDAASRTEKATDGETLAGDPSVARSVRSDERDDQLEDSTK